MPAGVLFNIVLPLKSGVSCSGNTKYIFQIVLMLFTKLRDATPPSQRCFLSLNQQCAGRREVEAATLAVYYSSPLSIWPNSLQQNFLVPSHQKDCMKMTELGREIIPTVLPVNTGFPQDPLKLFTLTPKVIALFQSKISIFTRVTGIATDVGLAVTVPISLQNKPDDKTW